MSESDLLDLLLGAIIVLVAAIGYWQGVVRGLLFLGGALLGSELALWWSDNVGDQLADWLPLNADTGRFISSTFFILAAMILIGAGFGSLAQRPPGPRRSRFFGVCVGVALGVITVGLVIRYFFIHMESRAVDALSETRIADFLWEHFDWTVLAVVSGSLVIILVGWVLGTPDPDPAQARQYSQSYAAPVGPPVSGPRPAADPSPSNAPVQPRFGTATGTSSVMPGDGKTVAPATADPQIYASDYGIETEKHDSIAVQSSRSLDTQANDKSAGGSAAADTVFAPHIASVSETLAFATDSANDRRESSGMCPNCGMLLRTGDSFCPDCGFPVEK